MINPETLLKRLRVNLRDDPLQNASRLSQLKLSKQIYKYSICHAVTAASEISASLSKMPKLYSKNLSKVTIGELSLSTKKSKPKADTTRMNLLNLVTSSSPSKANISLTLSILKDLQPEGKSRKANPIFQA